VRRGDIVLLTLVSALVVAISAVALATGNPRGLLWAPFAALFVAAAVVVAQALRQGRSGWWLYLVALLLFPLQLLSVVAWFAHLRRNPVPLGGSGITV
jgi:hypothetical protein